MRKHFFLPLLPLLLSCQPPQKAAKQPVVQSEQPPPLTFAPPCPSPKPQQSGRVNDPTMSELSGIAASRRHPGVLWVHNDSGHKARVYAIDGTGKRLASWKLKKVADTDWEDIAVGPCSDPQQSCIYLADTGDNRNDRKEVNILRWPEPGKMPGPGEDETLKVKNEVETFTFSLPNGPEDCEAMAVLPDGRVILFSKRNDGTSNLFRVTLATPPVVEALGTLVLRDAENAGGEPLRVTAADLHPNGKTLALRTYGRLLRAEIGDLLAGPAEKVKTALASVQWTRLEEPKEPHGEAIGWSPDGGLWTVSDGQLAAVWRVTCQ